MTHLQLFAWNLRTTLPSVIDLNTSPTTISFEPGRTKEISDEKVKKIFDILRVFDFQSSDAQALFVQLQNQVRKINNRYDVPTYRYLGDALKYFGESFDLYQTNDPKLEAIIRALSHSKTPPGETHLLEYFLRGVINYTYSRHSDSRDVGGGADIRPTIASYTQHWPGVAKDILRKIIFGPQSR